MALVPGAGLEPARLAAADFKSATSASFVTRAGCGIIGPQPAGRRRYCVEQVKLALLLTSPEPL